MANTAKKVKFLSKTVDLAKQTVAFALANGIKIDAALGEMSEEIKTRLALHGLSQKIGDAAAGSSKTSDYKAAFNQMQAVLDGLLEGVWATKGTNSDLAEALVRLNMAENLEEADEIIAGLDEDSRKAVAAEPTVDAEIRQIRADRAAEVAKAARAKGSNLAELLGKVKKAPEAPEEQTE